MTQTKLEILGPYTPEHEGPFCIDDKYKTPVELRVRDGRGEYPLVGYIGSDYKIRQWRFNGENCTYGNIMNAREVPAAREFWLNEFRRGDGHIDVSHAHDTELQAINERHELENWNWTRTIHVREVLPGEGE